MNAMEQVSSESGGECATVFCSYREFYWHAQCSFTDERLIESTKRTHGSAKQAADEVLAMVREVYGPEATMRKLRQKQYEITVPAVLKTDANSPL